MTESENIYCSLDLELTGFDPSRDTILEVGFVFFRLTPTGLEITEQWSQTFKPLAPVHPKILGLTGLSQAELDESPQFSEFREFIQNKIGNTILVGHNIVVDATFLSAFGIELSGKTLDTLDLVQWLLPTHHSYNLENLMHYFGIPHPDAHRALADSIATVKILEQLLALFNRLPDSLQSRILELSSRAGFLWHTLFVQSQQSNIVLNTLTQPTQRTSTQQMEYQENTLFIKDFGDNSIDLPQPHQNTSYMLAVPESRTVLRLWKQNLATGVFSKEHLFDEKKFEKLLLRADLSTEEIKFILKVLVWQAVNWQTETILDLNLTFFGGQFRNLIASGPRPDSFTNPLLVADYETLSELKDPNFTTNRQLVVSSLHELERNLSSGTERKLSWQRCLYIIRNLEFSNHENGSVLPEEIFTNALVATDLFFSLTALTIQKNFSREQQVSLQELATNDYVNNRIRRAAQNYIEKLSKLFADNPVTEITKLIQNLETFFAEDENYIKWIETSATNCILFNQPLHILESSRAIVEKYSAVSASENFPEPVLDYLLHRLGMTNLSVESYISISKNASNRSQAVLSTIEHNENTILKLLEAHHLPAAVIFGSLPDIKDFYKNNFDNLKQYANLYAQGYSGGTNKIVRNFGIQPNSILLGTSSLLLSQPSRQLTPKILIIAEFPRENMAHPYIKALTSYWERDFPEIKGILNTYLAYRLLASCWHEGLEQVFVPEPNNDEDKYIYENIQKLPFLTTYPQS